MENQNENRVFTPEELDYKKKEMLKFYKDSVPYLKAQLDHETLLMQIDDVRFKRTSIQVNYAMLMNQVEDKSENENADSLINQEEEILKK
jgi:hypothetical protein